MVPEEKDKVKQKEWRADHIFIRSVRGKYDELFKQIYSQPRVFSSKKIPSTGGPAFFNKDTISPRSTYPTTQAIESHIETILPGATGHKHGHMNSAVLYVMEGKGYEIHDGQRLDWQAGDVAIVRNGCVHGHFNTNPNKAARILVLKSKPLFMFLNMMFQKTVVPPSDKPIPGWEGWNPDE